MILILIVYTGVPLALPVLGLGSDLIELVDCPPYHRLVAGRKELDGMATGIVQGLA